MNSSNPRDERIKLHEAAGVAALLTFLTISQTATYTLLVARCYVVDAIDHIKRKGGPRVL